MQGSLDDIRVRIDNAYRDFARTLVALGGVTPEIAERLVYLYLNKRWAKLDIGIGRLHVKHGAYLDRAWIEHAAKTGLA